MFDTTDTQQKRVVRLQHSSAAAAALLIACCLACGCYKGSSTSSHESSTAAEQRDYPYENGYAAYEDIELIDGTEGASVLASGTIYTPDGEPCPAATVTLQLTAREENAWVTPTLCFFTTSDASGKYVIRGEKKDGFSICWATANGQIGVTYELADIKLRGGETVLYVRDEQCQPIANASVTVHLSGIDDMSFIVPPNIRALLKRTTDEDAKIVYPSRLADYDLGFEVKAAGHKILTRSFYTGVMGRSLKLFVLSVDHETTRRCREALGEELSLAPEEVARIEIGSPGHFHGH